MVDCGYQRDGQRRASCRLVARQRRALTTDSGGRPGRSPLRPLAEKPGPAACQPRRSAYIISARAAPQRLIVPAITTPVASPAAPIAKRRRRDGDAR
jgi:hypothetical protein